MLIPRRTARTSQPQVPVGIDWSNPITRGLFAAILPGNPRNMVDGVPVSVMAATGHGYGKAGRYYSAADGSQSGVMFTSPKLTSAMTNTTMLSVIELTGTPGALRRQFITIGDAWNSPYENCAVEFSNDPQLTVNNGLVYGQYPVPQNVPQTIAATFRGAGGAATYINGRPDGSTGAASPTINTQGRAGWLNYAYNLSADRSPPVKGYLALYWDRDLSDFELKSVTANPWQIFEDEEDYLFVPDASGGGSVSLIVADALHGHAVDSPSFSMATYLAVAESLHTQAADNLTLSTTGSANLAIQEAAHAHVSDGVALTTRWLLIVADALHTHAADNLTMGVTGATTLTVADATSVHTADSVALSVIAFLAIADAVSQHAADNLTLDTSNATFLTVQEATHSHGTDGIALTLDTWLAIVEAAHGHTADAPMLSLGQLSLQIADALHAMYSDIVFLTLPGGNLTTDQKFIIRATARRLAAIGLARNNIINRRAS